MKWLLFKHRVSQWMYVHGVEYFLYALIWIFAFLAAESAYSLFRRFI